MIPVLEPECAQDLARELAAANAKGQAVIPRGGGTKTDWGNPPTRADVTLSTKCLNRIVEHAWADLTVTVEAGCTVADLQSKLAEHNQRLAVDVLWPERATIGGILSTNDSGAMRLRYGSLRDLVIGITLVLPDGTIAESGGKVVKNVAGYDLPKLLTGALGTLGVITQAVFRLHPLPKQSRTITLRPPDLNEAQRLILAIQDSWLAHTALQIRVADGASPEVDVLLEGTEAGIASQESKIRELAQAPAGDASVWGATVWKVRQDLWLSLEDAAIVKFSVLPSQIAAAVETIRRSAKGSWSAVVQATGIGYARLTADLPSLRAALERDGGSLMILSKTPHDVWGSAGDVVPLMRAIKQQFDPKSTLNPGRFAGGI